jgi:hypothetical protein
LGAGFVGARNITPVLGGYTPELKNPINANKNTEEPILPYFLYLLYALSGRITIIECLLFFVTYYRIEPACKKWYIASVFQTGSPG